MLMVISRAAGNIVVTHQNRNQDCFCMWFIVGRVISVVFSMLAFLQGYLGGVEVKINI